MYESAWNIAPDGRIPLPAMSLPRTVVALCLATLPPILGAASENQPVAAGPATTVAPDESPVAAGAKDDHSRRVDAIFQQWAKPDSPGCVCAVIKDGKIIYAQGYGMADLEHHVPLTPDSVFYIASTSKQFTAASIALLSLDGKISLADDIHKYFPELHDYGHPVTVDELVHHTSGIRDYFALLNLSGWRDGDHLDNERVIGLLARQRELNFEPGTRFLYSNSNYVLLADLVRRASGQALPEFAAERIFRPLGMKDSRIEGDSREIVPNRVVSYAPNKAGYLQFPKTIESYGDGNVLTTVGDLARWDENFYSGKVGGPPLLGLILTRGVLAGGKPIDYAFGLEHGAYRGLSIISHGGAYMGFRTELLRFPDQHFSVAVLCNLASMDPDRLARRVANIYLAEDLAPTPPAPPPPSAGPPPSAITIDPKVFDAYVGRYALDGAPQAIVSFSREGDHYFTQMTGQARFPIFPSTETDFFLQVVNAQITFHRDTDGSVSRITSIRTVIAMHTGSGNPMPCPPHAWENMPANSTAKNSTQLIISR
jgi:CubicO group peptidase (beta-lactamase class C family)